MKKKISNTKKKLLISTIVIFTGLVIGYYIGNINTSIELGTQSIDGYFNANFWYIFLKNLLTCIIIIVGAGIISLPIVFQQGINLGFILGIAISYTQSIEVVLLALPHCLFEIPAIIISSTVGMKVWTLYSLILTEGNFFKKNYNFFKENIIFLELILILLLIAAIVESYITGYIFLFS